MGLYNLLAQPDRDFALRWHRDDIAPTVSAEEEEARLKAPILHAQWNLALFDDESLIVLPGSHARSRTLEERNAEPYEANLSGQKFVKMKAGDLVFYNNNILHRGVYDAEKERMTLHGSIGMVGTDKARARNVLQHGIEEWVGRCDFQGLEGGFNGKRIGNVAEGMRMSLLEMGSGKDVGFSQIDDM